MTHDHTTAERSRIDTRTIATVTVVTAPPTTGPARPRARRRARNAVFAFAAAALFLHAAVAFALDVAWPRLRDPEYGRRAASLRARVAEHPARPLVLVVGSSRAAMGVKPDAWEAARPGTARDPLLFNMSLVGSGPIMQLMTLRRALADGARPAAVLLEYWPPMLREDGPHSEPARVDARRLRWDDRTVVRDYFPDPAGTERAMRAARIDVFRVNRTRLLVQAAPGCVARPSQHNGSWAELDGWGWLPGMNPDDDAARRRLTEHFRPQFRDWMAGHAIHPAADRALREAVAVARAHGAAVGFLYLPESAEFRGWYPPDVDAAGRKHLCGLSAELGVPVINARDWMADRDLADGHHLSRAGAGAFTARLGPAVAATFLAVGGKP